MSAPSFARFPRFVRCLALSLTATLTILAACADSPDIARVTIVEGPNFQEYAPDPASGQLGVSAVFEKRCGTLDCHGQGGRPMRINSRDGLRIFDDAGRISGQGDITTPAEKLASYQSIISVEPEETTRVYLDATQNKVPLAANRLLVIKKARGTNGGGVVHKGGTQMDPGDPTDICLTSWFEGKANMGACTNAARVVGD